jgi:acetyl esterase/lipase
MTGTEKFFVLIVLALLCLMLPAACNRNNSPAQTVDVPTTTVTLIRDVEYGKGGDSPLLLDIYIPDIPAATPMPAIVYIHGGGWEGGDKYPSRVGMLAEIGFFCISINYRLSGETRFPAAVEDCKCAIRWLRANAEEYDIDPDRIGVWGGSAGGHLSMMVGCTDAGGELEGSGGWGEYSSRVQAVCSYYGPADLTKLYIPSQCCNLIGYTLEERPDLYEAASPISYVSAGDPPLLMVHGSADFVVPYSQSEIMQQAYKKAGLEVELVRVIGGGHGFNPTADISPSVAEINQMVLAFFTEHLIYKE